eukprot:4907533-Alexandrium_andersonii.AAC.1
MFRSGPSRTATASGLRLKAHLPRTSRVTRPGERARRRRSRPACGQRAEQGHRTGSCAGASRSS